MEHTVSIGQLPYPNGWFALAFSNELKAGRILRRRLAGEDVVLYRTRKGTPVATRPYCPHLGAHLGHGGKVEGENIVCPFHRFAFAPTGTCVATGYGTTPPKIRLETYPIREVNGAVFAWRHADGQAPTWELPELRGPTFHRPVQTCRTLNVYAQDMAENFVDTGHIGVLHRYRDIEQTVSYHGVRSHSEVSAVRPAPVIREHRVVYTNDGFGMGLNVISLVIPEFRCRAEAFFYYTPTGPRELEHRIAACASFPADGHPPRGTRYLTRCISRLLTHSIVPALRSDISADYPIWDNKVYVDRPRLTRGDGPIQRFRDWSKQFY